MNALTKHFKETHEAFKKYADGYTPSRLPDIKERWDRLKNSGETIDLDAFLKPFILGWAEVIEKNWYACAEQRKRIADDLQPFYDASHSVVESELKPRVKEQDVFQALAYLEFYANFLAPSEQPYHTSIFRWMKICSDVSDEEISHFFLFYRLNRDVEMRRILFDIDGAVREVFRSNTHGRIYLPKLSDWFLKRYDIDAASLALQTLVLTAKDSQTESGSPKPMPKLATKALGEAAFQRLWRPAVCFFALLALLSFTTFDEVRREVFSSLVPDWITNHLLGHVTRHSKNVPVLLVVLPYQIGVLFSLGLGVWWFWRRMKSEFYFAFRLILPRLLGGILLGYMPLVSSADLWKWLLSVEKLHILLILFVSPLALSLMYTYIEARTFLIEWEPTKPFKREIYIRATKVFLIGLSEAFIVGILLSEMYGGIIVSHLDLKTMPEPIVGFVGLIYPQVVLLYAPTALFIGLLVQLIWEEKSVTHPL